MNEYNVNKNDLKLQCKHETTFSTNIAGKSADVTMQIKRYNGRIFCTDGMSQVENAVVLVPEITGIIWR